MEGDIILNAIQLANYNEPSARETRAVTMVETAKWPRGIVAYDLSPDLSELYTICVHEIVSVVLVTCITLLCCTTVLCVRSTGANNDYINCPV